MKSRQSASVDKDSSDKEVSDDTYESVDPRLLELVRLRVAQMHHSLGPMEIHAEQLKSMGETEDQLEELETWATSSLFSDQDRAALALCEKITLNPAQPLSELVIQEMRHHFTKQAIISLTLTIMAVNDWNNLGAI